MIHRLTFVSKEKNIFVFFCVELDPQHLKAKHVITAVRFSLLNLCIYIQLVLFYAGQCSVFEFFTCMYSVDEHIALGLSRAVETHKVL